MKETRVPQCSSQHCLQKPGHGSNLMSIGRRMDKKAVVHIHNGVLLSHLFESVLMRWMKLEPIILIEVGKTPTWYINEYIWNLERW